MFSKLNRYTLTTIFIAVVSMVLGVISIVRGPHISEVSYDNESFPSIITLTVNTRLDETAEPIVTVTPDVDFGYTLNNRDVVIRFEESLSSHTEYRISISNLEDIRGKESAVSHTFKTAANSYVYIDRSAEVSDIIFQKEVGQNQQILYEADTIYDFVHGKNTLIVLEEYNEEPVLVEASSGRKVIPIPEGNIRGLYGSLFGDIYIVSLVDTDSRSTNTYLYDAANDTFEQLFDSNDNPIEILEATVAQDGETILYRDKADFTLYVDNVFDEQPALPLGVISKINRYFPDNSGIAVERPERNPGLISIIDTFSGDIEEIDLGLSTSLSTVAADQTAYAVRVDFTGESLASDIIIVDEESSETFYTPDSEVRLHAIDISLNDEFISIESSPKPVIYDNYTINSQPQGSTISILNHDGTLLESVPGSSVQWGFVE